MASASLQKSKCPKVAEKSDDDDGDDDFFCRMFDRQKCAELYFHPGPFSEALTMANLSNAESRI